jgi:predicted PurR-regulated permease PerM
MEQRFSNEQVKQVFFLLLITSLGILLFRNLSDLLPGLLGAITIYVLSRRVFFHLTEKKKWGKALAATLVIVVSLVVIVVPIILLINMLTAKADPLFANSSELVSGFKSMAANINSFTGFDLLSESTMNKAQEAAAGFLPKFFGATLNALTVTGLMYFMLFFMLVNGRQMEKSLYEYIPLKDENVIRLGEEVKNMVISNAIGIPVIAIIQSVFALVGYWIFGIQDAFFWFVVTCFTAMIPVIGSTIVWLPLAVYLLAEGHKWQGIGLIIWGFAVVGMADNIFRIMLARKIGDTHPLITIFGVLVGVNLFGFIGLIFGPLLITMFLLLLKIYSNEYFEKKREAVVETLPPPMKNKKKSKA